MSKMPFMLFYPNDWLFDTRILSDEEKAVWIDLLAFMWNAPKRGILEGHPNDLARMVGKQWLDFRVVLDKLKEKNVADVTLGNEKVTVSCRRIVREEKERESNRLRKREFDKRSGNAKVTDKKLEVISHKSEEDRDLRHLEPNGSATAIAVKPPPLPESLIKLWNAEAHPNLPRVKDLTEKRKRHINARLQEFPEHSFWKEILSRINRSQFLTGQSGQWKATFDWIINPTNLVKVKEGNYDNR